MMEILIGFVVFFVFTIILSLAILCGLGAYDFIKPFSWEVYDNIENKIFSVILGSVSGILFTLMAMFVYFLVYGG